MRLCAFGDNTTRPMLMHNLTALRNVCCDVRVDIIITVSIPLLLL